MKSSRSEVRSVSSVFVFLYELSEQRVQKMLVSIWSSRDDNHQTNYSNSFSVCSVFFRFFRYKKIIQISGKNFSELRKKVYFCTLTRLFIIITLKKTDKTTMKRAIIVLGEIIKNSGFFANSLSKRNVFMKNYVILQPHTIQTHYKRK